MFALNVLLLGYHKMGQKSSLSSGNTSSHLHEIFAWIVKSKSGQSKLISKFYSANKIILCQDQTISMTMKKRKEKPVWTHIAITSK